MSSLVYDGQMPSHVFTEMAQGYFRSRVLSAAARLGVADAFGGEERSVDQLAAFCGAQPGSLYRLLRVLASFGVVAETRPRHFVLTEFGQPLRKDATNSEWPFVVFWADLIADNWVYLTDCIRTGETAPEVRPEGAPSRWSQDPHAMDIFRGVMGSSPAEDYMQIALAWDFSKYNVVADLGGGGGGLIAAVLKAFPAIRSFVRCCSFVSYCSRLTRCDTVCVPSNQLSLVTRLGKTNRTHWAASRVFLELVSGCGLDGSGDVGRDCACCSRERI